MSPPSGEKDLHSSAVTMRGRFRWPLQWLLSWLFAAVRVSDDHLEAVRELSRRGTVVFVSRTAGILPYLYFNWLFLKAGLPPCRYVNGVGALAVSLLGRGPPLAAPVPGERPDEARLAGCVARDRPAMVFLWRRGRPLTGRRDVFPGEHVAALVRLQRRQDKPVFLVPCLLLFGQRPGRKGARPSILDVLFGPREAPGRLRSFLSFLRFRNNSWIKLGDPIDLSSFIESRPAESDSRLGRVIRGTLAQYLTREERVVTGPPLKHPERLRMELLRDLGLRDTLIEVSRSSGRTLGELEREAERYSKEIAARYSPTAVAVLERFFRFVFMRIYDGIEVDREGLSKVARAARKAPLVLCPSHRSHIDYLVLSWVFVTEGLMPPHIAAGKNLSFWPAGPILRRAGAFFMRRTFRDDPVYTAVFRAYIRRLLHERYPQEFFIEGGRSRTGKVLPPRLGMVAYEVEAFLESTKEDIFFVPISIGYTRVIEQGSYQDEILGGEKAAEDVAGLIRAGRVLRRRWGRIYIEFDEPISLTEFIEQRGLDRAKLDEDQRSRLVRSLAWQLAHGIDRATTVTPAALGAAALLSGRSRGMEMGEVVSRARFLLGLVLRHPRPRISRAVTLEGKPAKPESGRAAVDRELDPAAIAEAMGAFADSGLVKLHSFAEREIVEILPDKRHGLDYYKNNLLGHFGERSILAHALLTEAAAHGGVQRSPSLSVGAVRERAETISRLFSRELIFRPGVSTDEVFEERLSELLALRFVEEEPGSGRLVVTRHGAGPLSLLRMLTASLVEGYWLTARAAADLLAAGPVQEKELVHRILEEGRVLVLTGRLAASEALSKPVVQAALATLVRRSFLERTGRKNDEIAGDPAAVTRIIETLEPFVLLPEVVPAPRLPSKAPLEPGAGRGTS